MIWKQFLNRWQMVTLRAGVTVSRWKASTGWDGAVVALQWSRAGAGVRGSLSVIPCRPYRDPGTGSGGAVAIASACWTCGDLHAADGRRSMPPLMGAIDHHRCHGGNWSIN